MHEIIALESVPQLIRSIAGKDLGAKLINRASRTCVLNNNTVLVSAREPGTLLQIWEAQQYLLDLEKHGSSQRDLPEHVQSLCISLEEDGLSIVLNVLPAKLNCICSSSSIAAREQIQFDTSACTASYETPTSNFPTCRESDLIRRSGPWKLQLVVASPYIGWSKARNRKKDKSLGCVRLKWHGTSSESDWLLPAKAFGLILVGANREALRTVHRNTMISVTYREDPRAKAHFSVHKRTEGLENELFYLNRSIVDGLEEFE